MTPKQENSQQIAIQIWIKGIGRRISQTGFKQDGV